MIQFLTHLDIIDNSGAKLVQVIKVLGGSRRKIARVGDTVVVAIKKVTNVGKTRVKKGDVVKAIVARTIYPIRRPDGSSIRFVHNAAFIVDGAGKPLGKRILGSVAKEVRSNESIDLSAVAVHCI